MRERAIVDMGWGRLLFGHTFQDSEALVDELCRERAGRRDIALYLRDPHVVLSLAPDRLFLDPSHTYRLWADRYQPSDRGLAGVVIRRVTSIDEAQEANRIYAARGMVRVEPQFMVDTNASRTCSYFVAVDETDGSVLGSICGVDHAEAFADPENGASFWCLAVDPQAVRPGLGETLVRNVVEYHLARGREYVDLSVLHNNTEAIALYEKLGFERIPAFCVKHKNPINEKYFVPTQVDEGLNVYAKIITDEARKRGVQVTVLDPEGGFFELSLGGRRIVCRESLSELTTAVAMSRCDDKQVTRRVLERAGLRVPKQQVAGNAGADRAFQAKHQSVVVKPARGEQGQGVAVDVRRKADLLDAIRTAQTYCERVLLEQYVEGDDLRVIVIDGQVVAAATRRPATIVGMDGRTVRELIDRYNRRRMAATGGESHVPMDDETIRCIREGGHEPDDVLPADESLTLRKTANLHTGGTIHDVTSKLHPTLAQAAVTGAKALDIPVVGMDFIVPRVDRPDYVIIEANERPGLANHEPQPTAERFVDLLFPQSVPKSRQARKD